MIRRVVIEHWKSIEKLDLELGPLTVIVGPNGSGKSNFVDALRFVRDAVDGGLDRAVSARHGIDSIRQWSPRRPYNVTLRVEVESEAGQGHLGFTLAAARGQYKICKEDASWLNVGSEPDPTWSAYSRDSQGKVELTGTGETRNFRAEYSDELVLASPAAKALLPLRTTLRSFEAYSIFPNVLRTPQKPANDPRLMPTGENLTSVFKTLSRSRRHGWFRKEILSCLQVVIPHLEGILIQSLGGLMVPVFRVSEASGQSHDYNVSQISDGSLRILGLLTALYQPFAPKTIALEEPEQNVHPAILSLLSEVMKEVSEKRQILVTTHSPDLVNYFEPGMIRATELQHGVTTIEPISDYQKQAVMDRLFSLGELMAMEGLHA